MGMAEVTYQVRRTWDNDRVRKALKKAKIPFRQLALECNVTVQTMSRVLAGKQSSLPIIRYCCLRAGIPIEEVIANYVVQNGSPEE
jgi:hypothetical protein